MVLRRSHVPFLAFLSLAFLLLCSAARAESYQELAGTYQIQPGHRLTFGIYDGQGGRLGFLDSRTLRVGILFPKSGSKDSFVVGPSLLADTPVVFTATFQRDAAGRVTGLLWQETGKKAVRATLRQPHREEPVEIRNGDVTLRGTLALPAGPGPFPAIVFAHGSGDATRNKGLLNPFFLDQGFAVLALDKRGSGESTGSWMSADMDDLAGDVLAGVAYLKTRKEIDPKLIGVQGASQGGWVGSLAASRSPDVAFLIVHAGSGLSVMENGVYEMEGRLRGDFGVQGEELKTALEFRRAVLELARQGRPWTEAEPLAAKVKDTAWFKGIYPAGWKYNPDTWSWWVRNSGYESVEPLRKVHIPVLWFLGTLDWKVPVEPSRTRIEEALRAAGNPASKVRVLPRGNHDFLEAETGFDSEFPSLKRMVPGYWDEMASWLAELRKKRR
jgi:pimeloyl-ACP methyl ester carboxylesterase